MAANTPTPIQTSRGMAANTTSSPTTTAPMPPPAPDFFRLAIACSLLPRQTIVTALCMATEIGSALSIRTPHMARHCRRESERPVALNARTRGALNDRSEEHTSELQSPCNLVCRLLLENKKETRYEYS